MEGELIVPDITALGRNISKGDMESIALGYFNQDWNRVKEIKDDTKNVQEFNREILMDWKKANPGPDQKVKLAKVLYKVAKEGSYVDPQKITDILKVPVQEAEEFNAGDKLTDEMIDKLAGLITSSTELTTFAIRGLKMAGGRVTIHLNNNPRNITGAATGVINEWRNKYPDQADAYKKITKALEDVGMSFYVNQALK